MRTTEISFTEQEATIQSDTRGRVRVPKERQKTLIFEVELLKVK